MKVLKEFKDFAMRGNVVDMAVGIIIGAAFGKIVSTLVANIVTPPLGVLIGGVDFKNLKVVLKEAQGDLPAVSLDYGIFMQSVFDFIIVAFAIFMVVKFINSLKKKQAEEPAAPAPLTKDQELLIQIRDALTKRS